MLVCHQCVRTRAHSAHGFPVVSEHIERSNAPFATLRNASDLRKSLPSASSAATLPEAAKRSHQIPFKPTANPSPASKTPFPAPLRVCLFDETNPTRPPV